MAKLMDLLDELRATAGELQQLENVMVTMRRAEDDGTVDIVVSGYALPLGMCSEEERHAIRTRARTEALARIVHLWRRVREIGRDAELHLCRAKAPAPATSEDQMPALASVTQDPAAEVVEGGSDGNVPDGWTGEDPNGQPEAD